MLVDGHSLVNSGGIDPVNWLFERMSDVNRGRSPISRRNFSIELVAVEIQPRQIE